LQKYLTTTLIQRIRHHWVKDLPHLKKTIILGEFLQKKDIRLMIKLVYKQLKALWIGLGRAPQILWQIIIVTILLVNYKDSQV